MSLTQERLNELAEELKNKAIEVADGFYGDSETEDEGDGVDIEEWAQDLHDAEYLLREGKVTELTRQLLTEIECCCGLDEGDIEWLREQAGVTS